jgi:hypothetical protein
MRSVQVVDQSSETTTRAEHVIGIDESGNVAEPGPFALVAVRCPRETGERLAELLIEHELAPWQGKSQTLAKNTTYDERTRRVRHLISDLATESIQWRAAVGYSECSIHQKAAAVCVLAKQTITQARDFRGDALLLPDGAPSMYGDSQTHLRTQAAQLFDGSFQSTFGGVYVTGLSKADLTYPEATAADYLAGFLREAIVKRGERAQTLPSQVTRFDKNWREPSVSPKPFYRISGVSGDYGTYEQTRVAAWITGRHPSGDDYDVSGQWENTVDMLESEKVQQYLRSELAP